MATTTSGTLTTKVSSTASSPTVHYSAAYTATRSSALSKAVSVRVTFSGWLNSGTSSLGSGIKLTVYARLAGGSWSSAVLKSTAASWSGTTKHSVSLTLSGNVASGSAGVEFYVTRSGSTYSGSAGNLGSASSPKKYTAKLPAYSSVTYYNVSYSVSGDAPSGYSAPTDSTSYASGSTVTVKAVPSASGYAFAGWTLNGRVVTSFTITGNVTLYGVWSKNGTSSGYAYVKSGGTWKRAVPYIRVSGAWKKAVPYVRTGGTWKKGVS